MKAQIDPLAAALNATPCIKPGVKSRIVTLFGDRPDVLDAIRAARARGLSCQHIADTLSTADAKVSDGAVNKWLKDDALCNRR